MIVGSILLVLAALVVIAGAVCWLAGVQLMALVKVLLGVSAVLLTIAGVVVVTGDLLTSAGYLHSEHVASTKPIPTKPPLVDLQFTEDEQLHWMHNHTVGAFIGGPGFGTGRMGPQNLNEITTAPQWQLANNDVAWGPYVREAGNGKVHNPVPQTVANAWMGGLPSKDGSATWKVRKVYLLGLVKHPEPVVYLTDQVPNMKETKDVPTRELDAFEKKALETLKGGDNYVVEKNDTTIRVLGPIYAGKSCVKCHDQKGQLLGAFTYQLERVAEE